MRKIQNTDTWVFEVKDQVAGFHEELEVDVIKRNDRGRAFYEHYGFEQVKTLIHEETGQVLVRMKFDKKKR